MPMSSGLLDPWLRLVVDLWMCHRGQGGSRFHGGEQSRRRSLLTSGRSGSDSGAGVVCGRGSKLRGGPGHGAELLRVPGKAGVRWSSVAAVVRGALLRRSKAGVALGCCGGGGMARWDAGGRGRQLKEAAGIWACAPQKESRRGSRAQREENGSRQQLCVIPGLGVKLLEGRPLVG